MAQPVISYPGAKWRFYKHIKPLIPRDIKDFREPFFGGGSISLSIADDLDFNLERIQVGDLATEIWALWQGIKENAREVVYIAEEWFKQQCPTQLIVQTMDPSDSNYEAYYNQALEEGRAFWKLTQEIDCSQLTLSQRAARTLLVNKISFSGMGDSGTISKDQFFDFRFEKLQRAIDAQPLLQRMDIRNVSFEETMSNVDPEKTFLFLDPPYYQQEKSGLYGKDGDTHHGFPHEGFAKFTRSMPCRWFITYDDSIKVRKMFRGSDDYGKKIYVVPFTIPGGYTMAGKTSEDALAGEELFIANYDISSDASYDYIKDIV